MSAAQGTLLLVSVATLAALIAAGPPPARAPRRPNLVVIPAGALSPKDTVRIVATGDLSVTVYSPPPPTILHTRSKEY